MGRRRKSSDSFWFALIFVGGLIALAIQFLVAIWPLLLVAAVVGVILKQVGAWTQKGRGIGGRGRRARPQLVPVAPLTPMAEPSAPESVEVSFAPATDSDKSE